MKMCIVNLKQIYISITVSKRDIFLYVANVSNCDPALEQHEGMSGQRRRRWAVVVQMLYKCAVVTGCLPDTLTITALMIVARVIAVVLFGLV